MGRNEEKSHQKKLLILLEKRIDKLKIKMVISNNHNKNGWYYWSFINLGVFLNILVDLF